MNIALDVSNHAEEIPVSQFRKAKARGASRIIVALNEPEEAKRQIAAATEAGLEVEAYSYLYFARNIRNQIDADLALVKGTVVRRIWLDAEDTTSGATIGSILSSLREAERLVTQAGYRTGIYTAKWYWRDVLDNPTAFAHLPLWDAYWDKDADIDQAGYGGWTKPLMSQHTPDTHFEGIWCDINSYEEEAPLTIPKIDTAFAFRALFKMIGYQSGQAKWADGTFQLIDIEPLPGGRQARDTFTLTRVRRL